MMFWWKSLLTGLILGHRQKGFLLALLFFAVLFLQCSVPLAMAASARLLDPTPVSLTLNEKLSTDLEIIAWPDNHFSVPLKYLAKLLDIVLFQDDAAPEALTFTHPVSARQVHVDAKRQLITEEDSYFPFLPHALLLVPTGIFTQNDVYVDNTLAEKILGVRLGFNAQTQTVDLSVDRPIKILLRYDETLTPAQPDTAASATPPVEPDGSPHLFEIIGLSVQARQYQSSVESAGAGNVSNLFGSTVTPTLEGHLLGTPYLLSPSLAYGNGQFGMSALQAKVMWQGTSRQATLGTFHTGLSNLVAPNVSVMGLQVASQNSAQNNFQNGLQSSQITGINKPLGIGAHTYSLFVGRTDFQYRPPGFQYSGNNSGLVLPQSNKWLAGARYAYGVSDKFTAGISVAGDTLFGQPQTSAISDLINRLRTPNLLSLVGYRRDPNLITGVSAGLDLGYQLSDHWNLLLESAISKASTYGGVSYLTGNGMGSASQLSLTHADRGRISQLKVFRYHNNYYSPVTLYDSALIYDRVGMVASHQGRMETGFLKGLSYQGRWEHAAMNSEDRVSGGRMRMDNWQGVFSKSFFANKSQLQLNLNGIWGKNDDQLQKVENHSLFWSQALPFGMSLLSGIRRSTNSLVYNSADPTQLLLLADKKEAENYYTSDLKIPVSQAFTLHMGGQLNKTLNTLTLQGDLHWGGFQLSPMVQKSFHSEQDLSNIGCSLYYSWPSRRRIGVRYFYSQSSLPSFSALLGQSKRATHTLQFDFNDLFQVVENHLVSVGPNGRSSGILQGFVFLDRNQNGKREAKEPLLPGVPLKLNKEQEILTDTSGHFLQKQLLPGLHQVGFDLEALPITMTPTTPPRVAKIDKNRYTTLAMGVILTPGNVTGVVHLKDGNGDPVEAGELIVSLRDADTDEEMKFTYTNNAGQFVLGEIPPGTYRVTLDVKQMLKKHVKVLKAPSLINIPLQKDPTQYVEVNGLEFEAVQLLRFS